MNCGLPSDASVSMVTGEADDSESSSAVFALLGTRPPDRATSSTKLCKNS